MRKMERPPEFPGGRSVLKKRQDAIMFCFKLVKKNCINFVRDMSCVMGKSTHVE